LLISDENSYSLACERRSVDRDSTMVKLAAADFEQIYELFRNGTESDNPVLGEMLPLFEAYKAPYGGKKESAEGRQIKELAILLAGAENATEFADIVTKYYEKHGAGAYGLYRAFRLDADEDCMDILPIKEAEDISFDFLVGCEEQTEILRSNTEAFLKGIPSNNVLLYGDSGTGKSTSIRALMHDYYGDGLRLVELDKSGRHRLAELMAEIKKRNYRFIIFMDDLSFEEDESDYKELKAMLEGALESGEDNILIYATSNRRHLIRETWKDRNDVEFSEDVHKSDTMEEKLSLAGRFGVTIYYGKPDYKEYMNIVTTLAKREGLDISEEELADEARKWSLRHGSTSGRTAGQLIAWLKK
ncbi:MAG: ATP-binding protein, partial [Mogibacterium sp.]|nr:ATP-binding protein [Mogibacterium sp.]